MGCEHLVTDEGELWVATGPVGYEDEVRSGRAFREANDVDVGSSSPQSQHCPGAIQSFGVLIALEEDETGDFLVRQVSEVSLILSFCPLR
jgi:hypothetical protein